MEGIPEWLVLLWGGSMFFGIMSLGLTLDKILQRVERQNEILADIRWRLEKRIPD